MALMLRDNFGTVLLTRVYKILVGDRRWPLVIYSLIAAGGQPHAHGTRPRVLIKAAVPVGFYTERMTKASDP